jgi:integrase
VRALRAWLAAAAIEAGPIFPATHARAKTDHLGPKTIAQIVKRAAEGCGLDPSKMAGHSLRSGFITSAAKRGKSARSIMRQSGHRSEAVMNGYIHDATLFDDNAATGLL